ncbi:LDCC motif putative metal-binding protein [Finegoldia magna]|nr:LDCC motif putative metal-binding protein [Finegoldia magna]
MKIFSKIKKNFENFLKKLSNENKNTFGEERLDCCTMNKQDK